jgi:DNA-binding transcriptional ArsR family regulator
MSTALERLAARQKELETQKEQSAPKIADIRSINKISQDKKKLEIVPQTEGVSKGKYGEARVSKSKEAEVSPTRDFTKVSNSITKRAIPEKYFRGLSKHTYDVLYQKTRGAIVPTRTVQLTKDELVALTGLSKDAVKLHIRYLKTAGLIESRPAIGSHAGWEYEVFIPEELEEAGGVSVSKSKQGQGKASENLPLHRGQDLLTLTHTNPLENKEVSENLKPSLKQETKNDDEPFGEMNEVLKSLGKGKPEDWREFAELIKMEFDIAASRTKGVTNAPAFLTEHLRRRLMPTQKESPKSKSNQSSHVGKQPPSEPVEVYQAEPLTEEGRETTLKTFIGYIKKGQKEFLMGLGDTYTREDWEWLMKEIETK